MRPPLPASDVWPECGLCSRRLTDWDLDVPHANLHEEGTWEALLTLGNGYFATRGAAPEAISDGAHYPGTYVAGVYDRLTSSVHGVRSEDESIVNLPNWLRLTLHTPGGQLLDPQIAHYEHDHRQLDMRRGVLLRELRVEDPAGDRTVVRQERFVSMRHPHLGYLRTTVLPVNWSGALHAESWTDGAVSNGNVESFRGLGGRHLIIRHADPLTEGSAVLVAETLQSKLRIAVAMRTRVDGSPSTVAALERDAAVGVQWDGSAARGTAVVIDKTAAVFTSRDHAISEPAVAARRELAHAPEFSEALRAHTAEWHRAWGLMRLDVETAENRRVADGEVQRTVNLHLFHLAQTLSRHTADSDVGVPARGLHGEAYHGRVFWDELFVFPMLNLRTPELTRSLLMYRYRRLPEARRLAESIGANGALFPWQSGSDGREDTPPFLYNPLSSAWLTDNSRRQFHIGLAVAYNTWHYFQVTGDVEFLASYGAELLVEIARFWSARAEFDAHTGRYNLRGMMGPDEFHDCYPGRPGSGVDDNAYVAVLAAWVFTVTLRAHDLLGDRHTDGLWQRLGLGKEELDRWNALSRRLYVPFLPSGMMAQFEGYADLDELDLGAYRTRYGDIGRLDLILAAEGDSTNRYKVSKQADVLMLFYLFSAEELASTMTRLGYDFDPQSIPPTIEYYLARTTHGSTLSRVVHSWVLARGHRRASWHLLREALEADLKDRQGGTTREGIHLGAMAATADILQRGYTGLELRDDALHLHPQLPDAIDRLACELRYRGHFLTLVVTQETMELTSGRGDARSIRVVVDGQHAQLRSGGTVRLDLRDRDRGDARDVGPGHDVGGSIP
ncbi:glycoside hydrolase family 65 protein [Microbacterium cremeum]|uniref:glycoside hydrolase family 65 protein n=1 Tax=Microbacterium cremeum TaxID=2782169 RepID=UPI001886C1CD|nr:glycoside hydrolase family 65 protein [Microbacterium cremeum]